jgi:hypothetical protein
MTPEKEVQSMFKLQRKFALLAVPAVLAIGVVSYGSVVAMASPSHSAVVKAASPAEPAETATEPADPAASTTDPVGPNEPAGGGYADANAAADTQQEGNN